MNQRQTGPVSCVLHRLIWSVFACVLWQVVSVKALEKHLQQKKESDPVMTGILEEVESDNHVHTVISEHLSYWCWLSGCCVLLDRTLWEGAGWSEGSLQKCWFQGGQHRWHERPEERLWELSRLHTGDQRHHRGVTCTFNHAESRNHHVLPRFFFFFRKRENVMFWY